MGGKSFRNLTVYKKAFQLALEILNPEPWKWASFSIT
jgi:hypothetical protein